MNIVPLTLQDVCQATGGRLLAGSPALSVSGICIDSRGAVPGDLFVAVRGHQADGHRFVAEAAARGAVAALVDDGQEGPVAPAPGPAFPEGFPLIAVDDTTRALGRLGRWRRECNRARILGVTGSLGKTSAKDACAAVLSERFETLKSEGNLNTEFGLPMTLLRLSPEHGAAVLEMGMRGPGEIAVLCEIARPDAGVVTNVGPQHMELLGSIEAIAAAKAELPAALGPDAFAILNADDPRVAAMAGMTRARVVGFGLGLRPANWADYLTARDIASTGAESVRFTLVLPDGEAQVALSVPGRHQVYSALAAAAVGWCFGLRPDEIARGLATWRPSLGRGGRVEAGGVRIIDDTYNAAPASVIAALDLLDELAHPRGDPRRRRVAVLGDMLELGSYSEEGHRQVGAEVARRDVDLLVTVGPRARGIAASAREGGLPVARAFECEAADDALERLVDLLWPGDAVLVKGSRGLRLERIVAGLRSHLESRR